MNFHQPDYNQLPKPLPAQAGDKKRYIGVAVFILLAVSLIYGASIYGIGAHEVEVSNDGDGTIWQKVANVFKASEKKQTIENDPDYTMPKPEDDRWDLLVLGIRGKDSEDADETGAMLSDTMIIISYDKKTGKTSMVSIPRDFYVRIYGEKMDKINSAYEIGVLRNNSLTFTKKLVSKITGVYIDSAVVIDFSSFKKIIDDLGGIDVTLDRPFSEKQQWGYEFSLPAGTNHLDGENALYYARSRFSSSDFDRAQRQQKVIMAVKDKTMTLNLLSDPIKTLSILNTIRSNIETDLNVWDVGSLLDLSEQFSGAGEKVKRYVITTENLVYESHIQTDAGNLYVLLPNGDNLLQIKQLFQDILK
ncbi:MAG: LCP family protein [bacterium]|nr:LCP family protein [bacterium]